MGHRKVAVADKAIASAALEEIAAEYDSASDSAGGMELTFPQFLLEYASRVRFQPSTRQLVLTFDLDMSGTAADPDGNTRPVGE